MRWTETPIKLKNNALDSVKILMVQLDVKLFGTKAIKGVMLTHRLSLEEMMLIIMFVGYFQNAMKVQL